MHGRTLTGSLIILVLLIGPLLGGCGLLGPRPTPLPWLPTETPAATAAPQADPSATPAPTETSTPPPTEPEVTQTLTPLPQPTREVPSQDLTLEAPTESAEVYSPINLRGRARVMPFEGTLVIRVYDAQGEHIVEEPIIAAGSLDGPATFDVDIDVGTYIGPARIEILDLSVRDGSELAKATVSVTVVGSSAMGHIELPEAEAAVTLPIRLLARIDNPDQPVNVIVSWRDGTRLGQVVTPTTGLDGRGLLISTIDFAEETASAHPPTQPGAIGIHTLDDVPLADQEILILSPDDPETIATQVHWILDDAVVPQQIRIPRTLSIGRAALNALLWGPVPNNPDGYTTLIPTPEDVLTYPGRGPNWGEYVRVQHLRIEDAVAYVDFSPELRAHPGGAFATTLIREQIEATLMQFATVDEVVISIDGITGVLEP
jgi:hypothetical protein